MRIINAFRKIPDELTRILSEYKSPCLEHIKEYDNGATSFTKNPRIWKEVIFRLNDKELRDINENGIFPDTISNSFVDLLVSLEKITKGPVMMYDFPEKENDFASASEIIKYKQMNFALSMEKNRTSFLYIIEYLLLTEKPIKRDKK